MPFELLTGPALAGKTGIVLGKVADAAAEGRSPIVVVPSLPDVRRIEAELARKAPLGIRVATLHELLADSWALHGDGRAIIDSYGREALIRGLLDHNVPSLLGATERTPGFRRLFARFARDGLRAEEVARAVTGEAGVVLCKLLEEYYRELAKAGLVELTACARALGTLAPQYEGPIAAVKFDLLSADDLAFFWGLARSNSVIVAVTWMESFPPTNANDGIVRWLRDRKVKRAVLGLEDASSGNEITALSGALYSGPKGIARRGQVQLGAAAGPEGEAFVIAKAARAAVDDGTPAERILIVVPGLHGGNDALAAALRSARVPAAFEARQPLGSTALGRSLIALAEVAAGLGGRDEASEFAGGGFSGVTPEAARRLDREWRKGRVREPGRLLDDLARQSSTTRGCVNAARTVARRARGVVSPALWQKLADQLVSAGVGERAGQGGAFLRDIGTAYSAVVGAIAGMARADPSRGVDVRDVLESLKVVRVRRFGEERVGEVQVRDFADLDARRYDVVIVGGMTEGELNAGEAQILSSAPPCEDGLPDAPDPADVLRLRFYALVTRARERLVLIRKESDAEGRELRPSLLWDDVIDAYRSRPVDMSQGYADTLLEWRVTRADMPAVAPTFTEGRGDLRRDPTDSPYGQADRKTLGREYAQRARAETRSVSVTEVENYLACPYRWFYERVVRPQEVDVEIDAATLGTHAHEVLARFYAELRDSGVSRVTPDSVDDALALFRQVAERCRRGLRLDGSVEEEMAVLRAERWARNTVGQDADFLPGFSAAHTELSFGSEGEFEFGGVRFRGRIDRVDIDGRRAFVTDYKSSRSVPGLAKFEAEEKVQAVIYAVAVAQSLGLPVCGSVYRSLPTGQLSGFWRRDLLGGVAPGMREDEALDEKSFGELVERTSERVAAAVEGMDAGRIPRVPAVKGACAHCALRRVCEGAVL